MLKKHLTVVVGIISAVLIIALSACGAIGQVQTSSSHADNKEVHHVAAYTTRLGDNEIWCAPLQLCWNEAIDANGGAALTGLDNESVKSLNEQSFTKENLSEDHYYVFAEYVTDTQKAYNDIANGIKAKFNQDSELLAGNEIVPNNWFFYSMLYRALSYPHEFTQLDNAGFGSNPLGNYEYFGVMPKDEKASVKRDNVTVLYYNDKDNHAVRIDTDEGDVVVLVKNPVAGSPKDMYEAAMSKANKYSGSIGLEYEDEFKAPVIDINVVNSFDDLQGAVLSNQEAEIVSAMQSTKLKMDYKGVEIKSEAYTTSQTGAAAIEEKPEPRLFHYDDTYALFIVDCSNLLKTKADNAEKLDSYYPDFTASKNTYSVTTEELTDLKPYFAARIVNLDLFQG